jgi:hypothetical protein
MLEKICPQTLFSPYDDLTRFTIGVLKHAVNEMTVYGQDKEHKNQFMDAVVSGAHGRALYQQTLMTLGRNGVPLRPSGNPVFETLLVNGYPTNLGVTLRRSELSVWHDELFTEQSATLSCTGQLRMEHRNRNAYESPTVHVYNNPEYGMYQDFLQALYLFRDRGGMILGEINTGNLLH